VDGPTLQLLQKCDGQAPLRDLVDEMARAAGSSADRVKGPLAAAVRRMVSLGFLVPQ
jgi:hypothetical protein